MNAKQTWLTPAMEAWEAKFGLGSFPFGEAGRAFKPLVDRGGATPEEIGQRLATYLEATDPRFASVTAFAKRYQMWGSQPSDSDDDIEIDEAGVLIEKRRRQS